MFGSSGSLMSAIVRVRPDLDGFRAELRRGAQDAVGEAGSQIEAGLARAGRSGGESFSSAVESSVRSSSGALGQAGTEAGQAYATGLQASAARLDVFGQKMTGLGTRLSAAITAPIVAAGGLATREFISFEQGMAEVRTLMPDMSDRMFGDMTKQVQTFAKEFGVLPKEVVPALYQAISAGVPADNVFEFLEVSQKAARGGVTSLATAVDGITSVVNAYGADVISAAEASDLMFTAVKLGKTNFDQLSKSLFNVLPSASSAGVSFEEVTAAVATLTAQGVPTTVATTRIRAAIDELTNASSRTAQTFQELTGGTFRQFIAQGGSLTGAIDVLGQSVEGTETHITDLFGSVEAKGFVNAVFQSEMMASALGDMGSAAGATDDAYRVMAETSQFALDLMKSELAVAALELGENLLPHVMTLVGGLTRMVEAFNGMSEGQRQFALIGAGVAAVTGPLLLLIGSVARAIASVQLLASRWTGVTVAANGAAAAQGRAAMAGSAAGAGRVGMLAAAKPVAVGAAALAAGYAIGTGINNFPRAFGSENRLSDSLANAISPPGLATGGTVTSGGVTLVGEEGPELLNLPKASQVVPLTHGGDTWQVTINVQGAGRPDDVAKSVAKELERLQRRTTATVGVRRLP